MRSGGPIPSTLNFNFYFTPWQHVKLEVYGKWCMKIRRQIKISCYKAIVTQLLETQRQMNVTTNE